MLLALRIGFERLDAAELAFMPVFRVEYHFEVVNQVSLQGLAPSLETMGVGCKVF